MKDFKKTTSHQSLGNSLHPWYITGFSDGEACFYVQIQKHSTCKTGWRVRAFFTIGLHSIDTILLESIKSYFSGVGSIGPLGNDAVIFRVTSVSQLTKVIVHFDKYPLISKKRADYELFKEVVNMLNRKEHVTEEGLQKIVNIRASMNEGLSAELKAAFPDTQPVARPQFQSIDIPDPNWLSGFVDAEGCFSILTKSDPQRVTGVSLRFQVTQHIRDKELLDSFAIYLGCGKNTPRLDKPACDFQVLKNLDITEKIIPFFNKYPLLLPPSPSLHIVLAIKTGRTIKERRGVAKLGGGEEG